MCVVCRAKYKLLPLKASSRGKVKLVLTSGKGSWQPNFLSSIYGLRVNLLFISLRSHEWLQRLPKRVLLPTELVLQPRGSKCSSVQYS